MAKYVGRRLLALIPTLLFISLVTFLMAQLAPGDPIMLMAGEKATPETIERLRSQYGLDKPLHIQYVDFVQNAVRFDFGLSFYSKRPVSEVIVQGFGPTMTLALIAILIASLLGISLGSAAAYYKDKPLDRIAVAVALLGVTVPNFVLAPLLALVFSVRLGWLPVAGWDGAEYFVLPAIVLAARPMAMIARLARTAMTDALSQDYIRTAYAKGLTAREVVWRHALRNSMVVTLTGIGNSFGFLLTGSFIVETAFGVPGLGYKGVQAIQQRDFPVIQATTLLFATLFVLVNLTVDLLYHWLDPRIRQGGEKG